MRSQSWRYFLGSLFSRQAIYAYGIAGVFTTVGQLLLVWVGPFSGVPRRTEVLPVVLEAYIETLLPLWIPPITPWNVMIFLLNVLIALWVLLVWTDRYDRAIGGRTF